VDYPSLEADYNGREREKRLDSLFGRQHLADASADGAHVDSPGGPGLDDAHGLA
jgi:hypothetical protein